MVTDEAGLSRASLNDFRMNRKSLRFRLDRPRGCYTPTTKHTTHPMSPLDQQAHVSVACTKGASMERLLLVLLSLSARRDIWTGVAGDDILTHPHAGAAAPFSSWAIRSGCGCRLITRRSNDSRTEGGHRGRRHCCEVKCQFTYRHCAVAFVAVEDCSQLCSADVSRTRPVLISLSAFAHDHELFVRVSFISPPRADVVEFVHGVGQDEEGCAAADARTSA